MPASNYLHCYSAPEASAVGVSCFISRRAAKKNFQPLAEVVDSSKIHDLQTLSFHFKHDPDDARKSIGLVAEDTAAILPEIVAFDDDDMPFFVNYSLLSVLNLDQIQRMRKEFHTLQARLAQLETPRSET